MLLIDHQSGLFQCINDMDFKRVRDHAIALAEAATLAGIPVITTASVPQGPNGPLIPEIHQAAPHAVYVPRRGEINSWDCPAFVEAVKKTGRKTLIIAGTVTSVCLAFPAISAVRDGYKVLPCLMHPVPIPRWPRKFPLPGWSRPVSFPWTRLLPLPKSSRPGIVTTGKMGQHLGPDLHELRTSA